jgi:bisphosphoglycerate-independent phosphoglycerate mutase (AlkP superfamily)
MGKSIHLDFAGLLADRVGEHGLAGVDEVDARVAALRARLADVAPTVLELMGLTKPDEMTGESLLE